MEDFRASIGALRSGSPTDLSCFSWPSCFDRSWSAKPEIGLEKDGSGVTGTHNPSDFMSICGWIHCLGKGRRLWLSRRLFHAPAMLLLGLAGGAGIAAEKDLVPVFPTNIKFAEALPVVRALAQREGIAFDKIDPAADQQDSRPGDTITALVSLTDGDEFSQWLVQLTCVEKNEKERQRPPAKDEHLFSSMGTEIVFRHTRVAISVRVMGPYRRVKDFHDPAQLRASLKAATDVRARFTVDSEYLGLGLDRACEASVALREGLKSRPELRSFRWSAGGEPFPPEVIKDVQAKSKGIGLTPERERAVFGLHPAMWEFWRLASRTPGLQDILRKVADLPWWSIIMKGGEVEVELKPYLSGANSLNLEGNVGGYVSGYAFPLAVEVNGKPALACSVLVVSARPPLLTSAGILAIAAQPPDGKGPHLMVQISAAHLRKQTDVTPASDSEAKAPASGAKD